MEISSISFNGHRRRATQAIQCALKTCYKEGWFGDKVRYGVYGNLLKRRFSKNNRIYTNVSAEHIFPAKDGGKFIALATKNANAARGSKPIWEVFNNYTEIGRKNIMNLFNYLKQFEGIKIDKYTEKGKHIVFDGDRYIKTCNDALRKVGIVPGNPDADIKFKNIKPVKIKANRVASFQTRR